VHGIECCELRKTYGDVRAVDGVSFAADAGSVLAMLGSNGSGKTTTVRLLTTLSAPDSGSARVAGKDVVRETTAVREAIGVTVQDTIIDRFLTGREHLRTVARLRHVPRRGRERDIEALLSEFDLSGVADARVGAYSGGMRRRLDIAASLLGRPAVLFLDEPSTGLDPRGRQRLWDAIRRRAGEGVCVLLTTQYMAEADALADSVVVLARGRVVATGTPSQLKDEVGGRVVELTLNDRRQVDRAASILTTAGVRLNLGENPEAFEFVLRHSSPSLLSILERLHAGGVDVEDAIVRRPTLDEAFLHLTDTTTGDPPDTTHDRELAQAAP
jgi:ABC-type multidrug transport system ATPase subunit